MRALDKIVVHCSATPQDMDIGVEEIRRWHVDDRGWSDIGYHYVIRRNGEVETGRPIESAGAHARGHNMSSVGICLVGGTDADNRQNAEANFTLLQYQRLFGLILDLRQQYGPLEVIGHRDLPGVAKACPCFDARALMGGV